jgi:opacity protein-like surface antigen
MKKVRALSYALAAALALVAAAGTAQAQETAAAAPARGGLGIGIASMLRGPSGLNIVFDGGRWHADAILGIAGDDGTGPGFGGFSGTTIDLGARGWFHLHNSTNADFSLGGGLGFQLLDPDGAPETVNVITIDIGAQIRAFLTSNVALSAFGGLTVLAGDADGFALDGQFVGALGLTYFFW